MPDSNRKSSPPIRLAVLLSGSGRTLQNLADTIGRGELNATIVAAISSSPKAYGLQRAANLKIPASVVERKAHNSPAEFSNEIWKLVRASDADLVCLAGFLSLLTIPDDMVGRVINIHPALLPAFGGPGMYGHHVHETVLKSGIKTTGCTVHYCDQTYDTGQIILQRTCPVLTGDTPETLAARVFEQECLAYPEAIRLISEGKIHFKRRAAAK